MKLKSSKAIKKYRAEEIVINNPLLWPDPVLIKEALEPFVTATIITPGNAATDVGDTATSIGDTANNIGDTATNIGDTATVIALNIQVFHILNVLLS